MPLPCCLLAADLRVLNTEQRPEQAGREHGTLPSEPGLGSASNETPSPAVRVLSAAGQEGRGASPQRQPHVSQQSEAAAEKLVQLEPRSLQLSARIIDPGSPAPKL